MSEIPKSVFFVQDQQVGIAHPKKVPKKADTSIHKVADVALQNKQETVTFADFSKIKVVFDKKYTTLISEKKSPRLLLKLTRGVNWVYRTTIGAIINKVYKNIHREVYSKLAQVVNIETRKTQLENIKKALGNTEGEQAFSKKIDSLLEQLNQGTISPQNFENAWKNVEKGVTLIDRQKELQTCGGQCGKDLSTQITDLLKNLDLNKTLNSFSAIDEKYRQLSEILKIKNTLNEKPNKAEYEERLLTKISEILDSGKLEFLQSLILIHTQIKELNKSSKPYRCEIDLLTHIGSLLEQKGVENLSNDIKKINSMSAVIKELKTIKTTIEKSSNKFNCQNQLVKEIEEFLKNSNSNDLPNNLTHVTQT